MKAGFRNTGPLIAGLGAAFLLVFCMSFNQDIAIEIARTLGPSSALLTVSWLFGGFFLTAIGIVIIKDKNNELIGEYLFSLAFLCVSAGFSVSMFVVFGLLNTPKENVGFGIVNRMAIIQSALDDQDHNGHAKDDVSASLRLALKDPTPRRVHEAIRFLDGAWKNTDFKAAISMASILKMEDHYLFAGGIERGWISSNEKEAIRQYLEKLGPPGKRIEQEARLRIIGNIDIQKPIDLVGEE